MEVNIVFLPYPVNGLKPLALPQFFHLFAKGLGKPLSKASSGQTSDGRGNQPSIARRSLSVMGTNLLGPEAVLANEAFLKGPPRPDSFTHPASIQTQAGRLEKL